MRRPYRSRLKLSPGSFATAKTIDVAMSDNLPPGVPLIAETGGINAMIVDSTALPEQAVRDIVTSSG